MDVSVKVKLSVKGVDIELSPDDVKGLHDALEKLMGKDRVEYVSYPIYSQYIHPHISPIQPYVPYWQPTFVSNDEGVAIYSYSSPD